MKISFQGGVDTIYNAVVAKGSTPSAKTPSAISTAIGNINTGIARPASMAITYTANDVYHSYANAGVITFYVLGYNYAVISGSGVHALLFYVNGAQVTTTGIYWGGSPTTWYPVSMRLNNDSGTHTPFSVTLSLY